MSAEAPFREALLVPDKAIPDGLLDGLGQPAGRRYNVYRNNITASLTEALETGFPAIAKLLGEENFRGVARLYLRSHPPKTARMMFYGAGFGAFLDQFDALAKYPYLGAVARLEYAMRESYHSADHTPVAPEALAVNPDQLMATPLRLAPSVRLLQSRWPIYGLWAFNMAGGEKPQARGEDVVILRAEFDPEPHLLPPGGFAFLSALQRGETLGAAFDAALGVDETFDLSALLTLLLTNNALQGPKT